MSIPPVIRAGFLEPQGITRLDAVPQGMSGGVVYRCRGKSSDDVWSRESAEAQNSSDASVKGRESNSIDWALKRYPNGTSPARVQEIHRVVRSLSLRNSLVPEYARDVFDDATWLVDRDQGIWEFQRWVSGQPLATDALPEQVAEGAVLIASLHADLAEVELPMTADFSSFAGQLARQSTSGIPAIRQRLERMETLGSQLPNCWRRAMDVAPELRLPLARALDLVRLGWDRVVRELRGELLEVDQSLRSHLSLTDERGILQWVFRDIHREHLLFLGEQPQGMIDFDAIRVDIPAVDFSRWISSFQCFWQEPSTISRVLAKLMAEGACEESSARGTWWQQLTVAQIHKLISVLARSTVWISLGNWLVWLILDRRTFASTHRVAERLDWLIRASETTL